MDIRVVELLCSRLCHDLISPVGAIHNGLELIEEMEDEEAAAAGFLGEAVRLIAHASGQADRRLRLFRLAYGQAGREGRSFADARQAGAGWVEGGRTRLDWPDGAVPDAMAARTGIVKTLLCVLVLAEEALTHGGTVSVAGEGDAAAGRIAVTAAGRPGDLSADARAALTGAAAVEDLSPRHIHAHITGRFAEAFGLRLEAAPAGPERLVFRLDW